MDRALALRSDLQVDLAIIGAGAAGLMMAHEIAAQSRRLRLIVLEPRRISPNPRLWVFPARPGHALDRFVSLRLDRACIDGVDRELGLDRLDLVRASDVQDAALDRLASAGVGSVEQAVRIDRIDAGADGLRLGTSAGDVHASAVIDTRPGPLAAVPQGCWTQISWFVRAPSAPIAPGFSISRAKLEAGCVVMKQALALPDGSALIEAVGLCPPGEDGARVKQALTRHLAALGVDAAPSTLHRAVLPLIADAAPSKSRDGLVHSPAGMGGLRFGTGRAALRLARWAREEARRFARTGRLDAPPLSSKAERRAADSLIAKLEAEPETAADWINTALAQSDADGALRFLAASPPRQTALWPWRSGGVEA